MSLTYNHNRSYDERDKRFSELTKKQVNGRYDDAKYVVITTRDAADGCFSDVGEHERHYFKHPATAIAWAQHYSDLHDHVAGVFKAPEFICRVDVR